MATRSRGHRVGWALIVATALVPASTGLARAQITTSLPGYGPDYNYGPVYAITPDYDQVRSPQQVRRDVEIERRYNETLRTRIPDKKASNDPWKKMRSSPTAAAVVPDRYRPE